MASLADYLHLVADPSSEQEDLWRHEFEYAGYGAVKRTMSGTNGWEEARRKFALRWLREKESEVAQRERQMRLDAVRIEKDLDELRQEVALLQRDTARLRDGKTQMQRDTRQMLWGSIAAIMIAALSLCISVGHLFGGPRLDRAGIDVVQAAPTLHADAFATDGDRIEQHDDATRVLRRSARRRFDRFYPQ